MSRPTLPRALRIAQRIYGPAFEVEDRDDTARSMRDWAALDDTERSFALAHLSYLNLRAQALVAHRLALLLEAHGQLTEQLDEGLDALAVALAPIAEAPIDDLDVHGLTDDAAPAAEE
ncbi:MAG: hypothetical protein H6739_37970 [Alphaproteobacteria bacterium]|nr:hypothetical protein [Alphaproteobacteria bacterium]